MWVANAGALFAVEDVWAPVAPLLAICGGKGAIELTTAPVWRGKSDAASLRQFCEVEST